MMHFRQRRCQFGSFLRTPTDCRNALIGVVLRMDKGEEHTDRLIEAAVVANSKDIAALRDIQKRIVKRRARRKNRPAA